MQEAESINRSIHRLITLRNMLKITVKEMFRQVAAVYYYSKQTGCRGEIKKLSWWRTKCSLLITISRISVRCIMTKIICIPEEEMLRIIYPTINLKAEQDLLTNMQKSYNVDMINALDYFKKIKDCKEKTFANTHFLY